MKKVLEELKMMINLPVKMFFGSMAAISIAHNPVQHDRTKHVEIDDRHFNHEKIDDEIIDLKYISSREQTTNMLTKGLAKDKFKYFVGKLDMINIYDPT